jgi:hypothetical protein
MKIKYKYILIIFALIFSQLTSLTTVAQKNKAVQEKCLYHFDDLQRKQTWTDSYNGAGLHFIDFNNSSYIEAYMGKNDGGFINFNDSENSLNYGLSTASYTKIKKATFFGKVDYNNFIGQDMTYSGLIYPERYMTIVGDDRPAEKRKESYKLNGGFSVPIVRNLLFGLQINYETANLAKMKDLRHKTSLLDFEVTGGLIYSRGCLNIGANYYYRKFHENVAFSKIAEDDVLYNGYLYKGMWFGMNDIWSDEALNLTRPFIDVINGGSLQLEYVKDNLRIHNEITYQYQDGYTGPGASRSYSQSEGNIYQYKGIAQYETPGTRHYLRFLSRYEEAVNYDNVTNSERIGGITVIYYYGLNKTFSKRKHNMNLQYELALGELKCNPEWNISGEYNYTSLTSQSSLITPFYFTQELMLHSASGKIKKNFLFSTGMIDLYLEGGYANGSGDRMDTNRAPGASEQITEDIIPYQNRELLKREYEYLTAQKMFGEIGFRYSKFIMNQNRAGSLYFDAKYSYTKASDVIYHNSDNARIFKFAVGYSF